LLQLKAEAQQLEIVEDKEEGNEVYDFNRAINSVAVR